MDDLTAEQMVGLKASQTQMDSHLELSRERQRAETMAQMRSREFHWVGSKASQRADSRANQTQMGSRRAGSKVRWKAYTMARPRSKDFHLACLRARSRVGRMAPMRWKDFH